MKFGVVLHAQAWRRASWVRFDARPVPASPLPKNSAFCGFFIPARCAPERANAQRRMNGLKIRNVWLRFERWVFAAPSGAERMAQPVDTSSHLRIDRRT